MAIVFTRETFAGRCVETGTSVVSYPPPRRQVSVRGWMESHGKMNRKVINERVMGYGRGNGPGILDVSRVEVYVQEVKGVWRWNVGLPIRLRLQS